MSCALASSTAVLSAHRDVLDASPDTPEAKSRLIDELKSRGRAAVMAKAWRDAELLYSKGLELQEDAVLYANLALVQSHMGHYEDARQSSLKATVQDPMYVKGYWRLAQALSSLNRNDEALESMKTALELDPQNKALIKEVEKLQEKVKQDEELMKSSTAAVERTTTTTTSTTTVEQVPQKTTTTSAPSTQKSETVLSTDDEGVFSKSDHIKGYKVVNGKKTSYFHNELSEEAKNMIGDITPQRLEDTGTVAQPTIPEGASAWNKAGTWEERNVTAWAKETLEKMLLATSYTLEESSPAPGAVARVTAVSKLDGHASYATVRGKKRYIYEFFVTLKWELSSQASGEMTFPDVDGTCEGEYEMVHYEVDNKTPADLKPLLDRFVKHGGLRNALSECFDDWVRLFRDTY